jgi:hypothetical protein
VRSGPWRPRIASTFRASGFDLRRHDSISFIRRKVPDEKARGPEDGLSNVKRAELIARLAELDHLIEEQTAHVKFVREMGWDVPVVAERLERLKESRQRYLSALRHLLGESIRPGGETSGGG